MWTKGMGPGVRHLSGPSSFPLPDTARLAGSLHRGKERVRANAHQPYSGLRHMDELVVPWAAVSPPWKLSHVATVTLGDGHI